MPLLGGADEERRRRPLSLSSGTGPRGVNRGPGVRTRVQPPPHLHGAKQLMIANGNAIYAVITTGCRVVPLSVLVVRQSCGRVLELGTGAGVGLAWIVHGLGQRNDVTVASVERDPERAALVHAAGWPRWVSVMVGDEAELLGMPGSFDLIFADTPSSKLDNLSATIAALHPGGRCLVDDMDPPSHETPDGVARITAVRQQLLKRDPHLFCAELSLSVGVLWPHDRDCNR